jgi:hypothetical protein
MISIALLQLDGRRVAHGWRRVPGMCNGKAGTGAAEATPARGHHQSLSNVAMARIIAATSSLIMTRTRRSRMIGISVGTHLAPARREPVPG